MNITYIYKVLFLSNDVSIIMGIFVLTRRVQGSALHRYQCIAGHEANAIFANDLACFTADNVWNEGK
jgi:hypothetical protein